jgi:hypothetical protein
MPRERLDLPLKISLTNAGVEWFAKKHKMLKRLQMADNWLTYGIAVDTVPASSLRKMINVDYIASVELARSEFSSKSSEIIDLTKLIIHRILFKKFENESFRALVSSALITRWNRQNPGRRIDLDTPYNQSQIDTLFASAASDISAVSLDLQAPLLRQYGSNEALSADDRRLRTHLSDGFAHSASRLLWCVLTRSRGQPEYGSLVQQLRIMLEHYIAKALVSEYLALMVVELLEFAEFSHYQQIAWLLRGRRDALMADEPMRAEVRRHMEAKGDTFSLTYHTGSRGAPIGADHRLRVTIQEQGYQIVKAQLEALMAIDAKEHSLPRFSRQKPGHHSRAELGLHNLSFLRKECQKKDVGVEISLSKIPRTDLTLLNLAFQL